MSHYSWPCQVQKKCAHHVKNPCLRRLYYSRVDYFPIINPMYLSFRSFFSFGFFEKTILFRVRHDITVGWKYKDVSNLSTLILARKFKDLRLFFDVKNYVFQDFFFLDFYLLCKVLSILILNLNLLAKQNIFEKPF